MADITVLRHRNPPRPRPVDGALCDSVDALKRGGDVIPFRRPMLHYDALLGLWTNFLLGCARANAQNAVVIADMVGRYLEFGHALTVAGVMNLSGADSTPDGAA